LLGREEGSITGFWWAKLNERGGDWKLGVDGRITLKCDTMTQEGRVCWILLGFVSMILEF
jgi:hypothetical protein